MTISFSRSHTNFRRPCSSLKQIIATQSLTVPLRELRRLVRLRLQESRDAIGFNIAAVRAISKVANERKASYFIPDAADNAANVWAGLGLGSDVAAAIENRRGANTIKKDRWDR
jgi:hypothetical protein